MLDLGGEFGGEVVGLHDHGANAGDEEVVTEHGRDGDEEADDGGDERTGDAGGHGGEAGAAGLGDAAEGIHDAPDGAEQTDEGRTADSGGKDDHLGFQPEGGFADGAFHGNGDGAHLGGRDFVGAFEAGLEGFVDLGGAEELEAEFGATGLVDLIEGRAFKVDALFIDAQRGAVAAEEGGETGGLAAGEIEVADLGDHDRPTEDRAEEQHEEHDLALDGGFEKRVNQT